MKLASQICAIAVLVLFGTLAADLVWHGVGGLGLFGGEDDPSALREIGSVALSTLAIVMLATMFAAPISMASAILCVHVLAKRPRLSAVARRTFDVMVSVPSIAVGLVGWSFFCRTLGMGFSVLAGAMTLALMLIPVMTAAFVNGFDAVPSTLRRESEALGISRWDTLWLLVVPAARPALLAGVMLGVGRAMAETAALILTSGISVRVPKSLIDPGATLAVHIYHLARNVPGGEPRAYATALSLMVINVLLFGALARLSRRPG